MGCPSRGKRILTWVGQSHISPEAGLAIANGALEFPLLLGFFAGFEEGRAERAGNARSSKQSPRVGALITDAGLTKRCGGAASAVYHFTLYVV
jgi:hypothetical protein